jgi:serine/threonine-protein kinase
LQYAVEHTVTGSSHEVKEYTLGVQVFRRGSAFDPRLDPIVRVEARKLRIRLTKYYETEGEHDPLRIELPARGYVPAFRERESATLSSQIKEMADSRGASRGATQAGALTEALETATLSLPEPSPELDRPAVPAASWAHLTGSWRRAGLVGAFLVLASGAIYAGRMILRGHGASDLSPSIAVLPFQNLGDVKDESFSDGLTDELIDSLGRVRGLRVVARTSAFQFRTRTLDIREIGKKLNVRTVLEGSVRIYGNRLRITVDLDDTADGYRVWSNSYERNFEDALFIQRDISQAIVGALREQLAELGISRELTFSPAEAGPVNVEAYRDYLRGLYFWNKQTTDSIETAKNYFEHAIALDPGHAPSYTGLARCYANLPAFSKTQARDVVPKIRELALRALQLDSTLPEAHIDLAYVSFLEYDWAGAEAEFKKGLELSPGDAVAHRWYSTYLATAGRLDEGLAESETAQQLDPVSPYMLEGTARSLYRMRRYDEAVEQYKKALALDPQFGYAHLGLGSSYIQIGKYREAIAELQLARQWMGNNPTPLAEIARVDVLLGKRPEARNIIRGFLDQAAAGSFPAKPIADVYLALGEKDQALDWLAKGVGVRDVYMYLKSDPIYDTIRSDPRFIRLLQEARLTPSH